MSSYLLDTTLAYLLALTLFILPAITASVLVTAILSLTLRAHALSLADSPTALQRLVQAGWDGRLNWWLDEKAVREIARSEAGLWPGTVLGTAAGALVLWAMHQWGLFMEFSKGMGKGSAGFAAVSLFVAGVITFAAVLAVSGWISGPGRIVEALKARVAVKMERLNGLAGDSERLRSELSRLVSLAERLAIPRTGRWREDLDAVIQTRIGGIVDGSFDIQGLIAQKLSELHTEAERLEAASGVYEGVLKDISNAVTELAPLGSRSMLDNLDLLRGYIETAKDEHLPRREWELFGSKAARISETVRTLRNYAREGEPAGRSGAEEAYRTLGVPRSASKSAIRKRWLVLQRILHPDRLSQMPEEDRRTAEEMLKQVNRAYETVARGEAS
jgi:DnaJ-domain-containing protein 1